MIKAPGPEFGAERNSVFVIGLRGFPDVQGGVETHAEQLYPRIHRRGYRVICATRKPYQRADVSQWQGIEFVPIWAPRSSYFEAIAHSILSVFRAARMRPDVVHIHAVGPALVVPLARLFRLRVVVTHHGPDYDREKWNPFAKFILRMGEWAGMRFSNQRIVISPVISDLVRRHYDLDATVIPNGVPIPKLDADNGVLEKFELRNGEYILLVSRIVPEKRHLDLISAFQAASIKDWKLVLVGDADHGGEYVQTLKERVSASPDVVLTGYLGGAELKAIYQYAGIFVLPSSHEGLPISLLEALSFGLRCIASAIPANLAVSMEEDAYFQLGDIQNLAAKLRTMAIREWTNGDRDRIRKWTMENYNWERIADQTVAVYDAALHS